MKNIFLILVILLPVIGRAQSKEGNKYYKEGKKLLKAERYEEAIVYFKKSEALYKSSSPLYYRSELKIADCYSCLSLRYCEESKYSEAIQLCSQAMEIWKKYEEAITYFKNSDAKKNKSYPLYYCSELKIADCYTKLAKKYYDEDNYSEAKQFCTQALEIQKKILGEDHFDYALSLHNLSVINSSIGNYSEAIKYGAQAVEIHKKLLGEEDPFYLKALNSYAVLHSDIGNYHEAIRLCEKAIEINKRENPEWDNNDNIDNMRIGTIYGEIYVASLLNLSGFYAQIGDTQEAIRLGTQVMKICERDREICWDLDEARLDYAQSLNNLAGYYNDIGNYTEAIRLCTQALEIRRKVLGEEHPDYALSLGNLASYNFKIGNYTEAIRLCTQALEIRRKVFGEEHPEYYAVSLNNLAYCYFAIENYDEAVELLKQVFECKKSSILKNFASMTEKERANFWSIDSWFFSDRLPDFAYNHPTPTFATLAYYGQLLSKGLLLNAELEVQKIIAQSSNKDLEKRYYSIRENRIRLDKLYQQPLSQRTLNTDSLLAIIEKDEKYLVEHIKELGDYTRNLSIEWQDVQNKLSDKDVAIEFADFEEEEKHYYIALILKKGMSAPEVVRLSFSENDLTNCYQSPSLYNAIWKPIEKYLNGVENVYFAPSGKLHIISIESLPDENGKIFSSKYHAYRLSSTRNLALPKPLSVGKKALLYGNIEYGAAIDSLRKHDRQLDSILKYDKRSDSYSKLYETELEIESIAVSLNKMGYNTNNIVQVKKVNATEYSFKMRSKQNYNIIHLATHGYFKKDTINNYSMLNSGLVFAGAENLKNRPDTIDDGLLTAQEISYLDLKNTDLLVLSACETALGEISSEGVFGLQRGFKKAGVNTIVMSLKKVYDTQTKEFMICFYDKMASGLSKHDAFVEAQQVIREKYKNDNQKKDEWTNFIMLDGVE